jgi:hypothetical protein
MIRRERFTEAFYLPRYNEAYDANAYYRCVVRSMTPRHYNIDYNTPDGQHHNARVPYDQIFTAREVAARTAKSVFSRLTDYLAGYIYETPTTPYVADDAATIDPAADADTNMRTVIRCCMAAAEEVIKCHDPANWQNWCCDLLNLLSVPDHMSDGDTADFLHNAQSTLQERINNGHW